MEVRQLRLQLIYLMQYHQYHSQRSQSFLPPLAFQLSVPMQHIRVVCLLEVPSLISQQPVEVYQGRALDNWR